jgi:hypothetical protein
MICKTEKLSIRIEELSRGKEENDSRFEAVQLSRAFVKRIEEEIDCEIDATIEYDFPF